MDRKKELKLQYKELKTDMGIYSICSKANNKCFIEGTQDLKGTMNAAKFKLGFGSHPNRELQRDWKDQGEGNFTVEILENLEYGKDESKTGYNEELALMKMMWEEKFSGQGVEFYKK